MKRLFTRKILLGSAVLAAVACLLFVFAWRSPEAQASPSPYLTLSLTPAQFPDTELGGGASLMVVTVQNTGWGAAILEVSYLGDDTNFSMPSAENDCQLAVLFRGQSCTAHIYFEPLRTGYIDTFFKLWYNGLSNVQATVSGFAYVPPLMPSTTAVDFGRKTINSGEETRTVRLFNKALVPITVTELSVSGAPFGVSQACATTIAAGAHCDMEVGFNPTAEGLFVGSVNIRDAFDHDLEIDLYGQGVSPGEADIHLSTTAIVFGKQQVGTTSPAYPVTIVSTGTIALDITDITTLLGNDFSVTNAGDCEKALAPSESCTIEVVFTPSAAGRRIGEVSVVDNAPDSPQKIDLSGLGFEPGHPAVDLSTHDIDFGPQSVGTSGEIHYVVLENVGDAELVVDGIVSTGDFSQESDCIGVVAAGGRCAIAANFAPTVVGDRNGAITITDSAAGSPRDVTLRGTGTAPAEPQASLSATALEFGDVSVQTAATQTLIVTNSGTSDLAIGLTTIEGEGAAEFGKADGCRGAVVEPGTTCSVDIIFLPGEEGEFVAALAIDDNTADSPHEVALSGNGVVSASGGGCSLSGGAAAGSGGVVLILVALSALFLGRKSGRRS